MHVILQSTIKQEEQVSHRPKHTLLTYIRIVQVLRNLLPVMLKP